MGAIAIGAILAIIFFVVQLANSKSTEYLVKQLYPLKGKSYDTISGQLMKPQKRTNYTDGDYDCEWITSNYQIVLRFDKNNICKGVVSESHESRE